MGRSVEPIKLNDLRQCRVGIEAAEKRTGDEVNIGRVEWRSSVGRHASFCSQARRHRVIARSFPRGHLPPSFLSGPYRSIPHLHPGHPGHPPSTTPHSADLPSPSTTVSFSLSTLIPLQSLFFRLTLLIMTSLAVSSSGASSLHYVSSLSFHTASSPPSPRPLATSSASSSQISFSQADEG